MGVVLDFRFALRQLRRSPGYAVTVGLTVALAIGMVAALVSVLRATVWSQLPYPHAEQLVLLGDRPVLAANKAASLISVPRFEEAAALERNGRRVFAAAGSFYLNPTGVGTGGQEPRPVQQAGVSDDFFATIGSVPMLGRTLVPADNVQGAPARVVLSYGLWQSLFAADPAIVGRSVRVGDAQATVIGVMGPRFAMPASVDLWTAGHIHASNFGGYRGEGSRFLNAVARLQPGESDRQAGQSLQTLAAQLGSRFPISDAGYAFTTQPLRESLFGGYKRALALVAASVAIVLLVVLLNLCGLQIARSIARQGEFRIRATLGVTEGKLMRQLVMENLVLLGLSCTAGFFLAVLFLRLLLTRVPAGMLQVDRPHLDVTTAVLTAGICVGASLLTSVVTLRLSFRARPSQSPIDASGRVTSARAAAAGRLIAVAQVASAFVLLALSASVLTEMYRLMRLPLGFSTANVETFTVDKGWGGDAVKTHALYSQLEARLAALPGVQGVGAMTALPLNSFHLRRTFDVEGKPLTSKHDALTAETRAITPGLLPAMRIPLLAGRGLVEQDSTADAPQSALVNQALADRYFAGESPIGRSLLMPSGVDEKKLTPVQIVGVVGNVRGMTGDIAQTTGPEVYFAENGGWPHMEFAVRTETNDPALESTVRSIVRALDASASVGKFSTMSSAVHEAQRQPALNAELLTMFAAFGVVLVMLGVYGLAAFNLSQRGREFAVRMALGSTREGVFRLMFQDALRVLAWGLPLGAAGMLMAGKLLRVVGFTTAAIPAWTYPVVALALAVCSTLATLQPARRAARLEPMEALRAE